MLNINLITITEVISRAKPDMFETLSANRLRPHNSDPA
jgi:hypothetical protein